MLIIIVTAMYRTRNQRKSSVSKNIIGYLETKVEISTGQFRLIPRAARVYEPRLREAIQLDVRACRILTLPASGRSLVSRTREWDRFYPLPVERPQNRLV